MDLHGPPRMGDIMSGILFSAITQAREAISYPCNSLLGRSSTESGTESLTMTADGRECSPNKCMTNGAYFGNFQVMNAVTVPPARLMSTSRKSRHRGPCHSHQPAPASEPGVRQSQTGLLQHPDFAKPPRHILMSADVSMSSWCKFNFTGPKFSFSEILLGGRPYRTTHGGGVLQPGTGVLIKDYDTGTITMILSTPVLRSVWGTATVNTYSKAFYKNSDLPYEVMAHFNK